MASAAAEEDRSFDFGWFNQYLTWHHLALYALLLPSEEWERELQEEDTLFAGLGDKFAPYSALLLIRS